MFDLGGGELLLILVAVLLLFGPKKLPELAQGLGKGLRQFRKAQQDFTEQINTAFYDEQRKENTRNAPPAAEHTIARGGSSLSLPTGSPEPDAGEETETLPNSGEMIEEKSPLGEKSDNSIVPPNIPREDTDKGKGEEATS
ncbi:MAG: twin-arginine translocase TatA/TatE family subunit [Ignavibacteriae bacterium]|nr:twin-arginine translocase TatA/TatE family subunit [Ignavibacteriota bacterium]MCB9216665.1 twin-arginine translocase TatA/TatE family subunit [Ignavibacteria bacterium]